MTQTHADHNDTDQLIWEYLDGEMRPEAFASLSTMLTEQKAVREQLAKFALMHSMLFDYFAAPSSEAGPEAAEATDAEMPRKRRKRGRSSAA